MRVFYIAGKDIRRFLGDRKALIVSLILPLVLTFIMGLSFGGGVFGKSGISSIQVAIVASDVPGLLRDKLVEGLEESGFFSVTWVDSLTADQLVRKGDASAAIVLPDDLMNKFFSNEEVLIEVWKDPGSALKAGIVEEVISRSLRNYQAGEAAYFGLWPEDAVGFSDSTGIDLVENYFEGDFSTIWSRMRKRDNNSNWQDFQERFGQTMDRHVALNGAMGQTGIQLEIIEKVPSDDSSAEEVNLFNYFLPTFAVFFLMFALAAATRDFHREKKMGTLQRQLLTPLGAVEFVLGKWMSAVLQGCVQLFALFVAGALLFQVNLGPDLWSLPLAILLTCSAGASFFLLLILLCPDERMADNLSTIVVLVSAMLGGNMVPVDSLPTWIANIGQFLFNYWANLSFSSILVSNENLLQSPLPALVLSGATVVLLGASLGLFLIKYRKGGLA